MATDCNQTNVPQLQTIEDVCNGRRLSTECIFTLDEIEILGLPQDADLKTIIVAMATAITSAGAGVGLGETSLTAYRGDRGKIAYNHTSLINNPHSVTKSQVGLPNADNTSDINKPISTATQVALEQKAYVTQLPVFADKETPIGSVNGINTVYTLAFTPVGNSEHVYKNGILQTLATNYTITGGVITMSVAPVTNDKIRVSYRR